MKALRLSVLSVLFFGALSQAVADDASDQGFANKNEGPRAHVEIHHHGDVGNGAATLEPFKDKSGNFPATVEIHHHHHGDVGNVAVTPEPFKDKSGSFPATVEIHHHYHPDVRDVSAGPEPFKGK